eukprot:SM000125S26069  [mRNA]  locus=s125:164015:164221:+ [translate_table: standard]
MLAGGFFFGLATAPAHVEDELADTWLEFAQHGPDGPGPPGPGQTTRGPVRAPPFLSPAAAAFNALYKI